MNDKTLKELKELAKQNHIKRYYTMSKKTLALELENQLENIIVSDIIPPVVAKSPIKWAGGKHQSLNNILSFFPINIDIYYELFLGGGSVLIALLNELERATIKIGQIYASDINEILIDMFITIKHDIDALITPLLAFETKYNSAATDTIKKELYENVKSEYNDVKTTINFMILNKTCFRGLYRVNKLDKFNVPFGNYKTIKFDVANLIRLSALFIKYNVIFECKRYTDVIIERGNNNVVYLDPPYINTFNNYSTTSFDNDEFVEYLNSTFNALIISNSAEFKPLIAGGDYYILDIQTKERINAKQPQIKMNEILFSKLTVTFVKALFTNPRNQIFDIKNNFLLRDWILTGDVFKFVMANKKTFKPYEFEWGNKLLGRANNKMWSGELGEKIAQIIFNFTPKINCGDYIIDGETDNAFIEVKTRNFTTSGTAGEKIMYAPIKYGDITATLNKPLKIVVCAYQEYELLTVFAKKPMFVNYVAFLKNYNIKYSLLSKHYANYLQH